MMARLIIGGSALGLNVTMGECYRTQDQQDIYFKTGFSKVKYSKHQERLAVVLNLYVDGHYSTNPESYRPLGELWESLGGVWGGRFNVAKENYETKIGFDAGHFEYND